MTTGSVAEESVGEGAGGQRKETSMGHRKMAAALAHILTPSGEKEVHTSSARKRRKVQEQLKKKRHCSQSKAVHGNCKDVVSKEDDDTTSEGGLSSDEDVGSLHSTSGDVVAGCRRLPDVASLDHERRLQRIATTGVVQLFNAVSQHTKEVQSKIKAAGPSERKKAKVLSSIDKGSFIDLLKGHKPQEKPTKWPALKEDYMLGAKMRDWGRRGEGEGDGELEGHTEQSQDSGSSDND